MTHSNDRENCLERARMHERLASTTNDTAARQMHQAMAAEFKRRADQLGDAGAMQPINRGPILELYAANG
jgi:hypothetical protein